MTASQPRKLSGLRNFATANPSCGKPSLLEPESQKRRHSTAKKSGSGVFTSEPLVLLRQNYCGRGGGVSFGCLCCPPCGCRCPWPRSAPAGAPPRCCCCCGCWCCCGGGG